MRIKFWQNSNGTQNPNCYWLKFGFMTITPLRWKTSTTKSHSISRFVLRHKTCPKHGHVRSSWHTRQDWYTGWRIAIRVTCKPRECSPLCSRAPQCHRKQDIVLLEPYGDTVTPKTVSNTHGLQGTPGSYWVDALLFCTSQKRLIKLQAAGVFVFVHRRIGVELTKSVH